MLNEEQSREFCSLRRRAIELDYMDLNPPQREAVMTARGPLLLLAGAGSGKTTVLIRRIGCLLKYGRGAESTEAPDYAGEEDLEFLRSYVEHPDTEEEWRKDRLCTMDPVLPWSIIAITFTNKAAGELKSRLESTLGSSAEGIWASTFHSACVRILRRDIEKLGMSRDFTIYDTDDSQRVVRDILKDFNLDDRQYTPRSVLSDISRAKDRMLSPEEYLKECRASGDWRRTKIAEIYQEYQSRLWKAGALDFDDLIYDTVRLLQEHEDVRGYYQNKFRYVLVDEYQDTSHMQYLLVSLLAGKWKNICVVGDDDQSIYRFRGATIENILSFEEEYPGTKVIRLEQNYRSTGNILNAANAVIRNNMGRKGKTLWTEHPEGEKVVLYTARDESEEARYVAGRILEDRSRGGDWKDHAVLYRMNAQSRALEDAMKYNAIPYRIVGGIRFFERSEVKDMLAYLTVVRNPDDDLRLSRILNVPARGIGQRTLEELQRISRDEGVSLWNVICRAGEYPQLGRAAGKLNSFAVLVDGLREKSRTLPLEEFYQEVLEDTGYLSALLEKNTEESRSRMENVQELASSIRGYEERAEGEPTLSGFLDEIALYTDLDSLNEGDDYVVLMTIHSSKGLEFDHVYVTGMEDEIFPSSRSMDTQEDLEEERRLCYVAMTRARETLTLTCARQRLLFGRTSYNRPSTFTREIPDELLNRQGQDYRRSRMQAEPEEDYEETDRYGYTRSGWQPERSSGSGAGRKTSSSPGWSTARSSSPPGRRSGGGSSGASFRVGEMVEHTVFGRGMVVSVRPMGGDALLEIAFDEVGTKKLMQNTASQYMKKAD